MFKQCDVAPIMTFDGVARPVPTTVIIKLTPTMMAGKPFHIVVYTKIVDGVQTLGGTNFWSPEEVRENVLRVGTLQADAREFKAQVQQALLTGGSAPQPTVTPPPPPPTVTTPPTTTTVATPTVTGGGAIDVTTGAVDDTQSVLDELGI